MAIRGKFLQQPVEVLDYEFDFTDWLADRSDAIVAQSVTAAAVVADDTPADPAELTISDVVKDGGVVRFFAAGGTHGVKYIATCTITTSGGRTKQSELAITVKET